MTKKIFTIAMLSSLFLISCKETAKQVNSDKNSSTTIGINSNEAIAKWKKELVDSKQIGTSCNFENSSSTEAKKWAKDNAGQLDGLPKNDTEIKTINSDFDGDNKEDLLMYFTSTNCSGHNGGTPSFAKLIYANSASNAELMKEIKQVLLSEYETQKSTNNKMKDISDSYLNETLTISYKDGIIGTCKLYATDDAHCCPSYNGNYSYNVKDKKIKLVLNDIKK